MLVYFLSAYDWGQLVSIISNADVFFLILAIACEVLTVLLVALRWRLILKIMGVRLSLWACFQVTYACTFINQLIPSNLGGDVFRTWEVYKKNPSLGIAMSSVILDRVVALFGLAVIVLCGLPWLAQIMPNGAAVAIVGGVSFAAICALAILLILDRINILPGMIIVWIQRVFGQISTAARQLLLKRESAAKCLSLSISVHLLTCFSAIFVTQALDIHIGLVESLVLFPPIILVGMLPFTIAGWGVREGVLVILLGFIGIPGEEALAISIVFGMALLIGALPGGISWVAYSDERKRRKDEPSSPPSVP